MIRVGQIGCGMWGRQLLRVLSQTKMCEIPVVADVSRESRDFVKKSFPSVKAEENLEMLLQDSSLDALVIAVPASDHYRLGKAALLAGMHTFVEKPLAMNAADAQELVDLAQERGLILMAGHTFIYNPAIQKMKQLIQSGELGQIYYISSRRLNLGVVRQDVNVLWNLAPHDISILSYWLEAEPNRIEAYGMSFLRPDIEDIVFMHMEFPDGVSAHVHLSWLDPQKVRSITIVGSQKMAVVDDVSTDAKVVLFDAGVKISGDLTKPRTWDSFGEFQIMHRRGEIHIPEIHFREPLLVEMEHFLECIETGAPPITGGAHAVGVVRVLEEGQACLKRNALGSPGASA